MSFDWKSVVKKVAPFLGAALGGPMGGLAAKWVGDALLGNPNADEEEIAKAVMSASPDQLLKLKELEVKVKELETQQYKIDADDRANARANNNANGKRSIYPDILSTLIVLGFFGAVWGIMNFRQDQEDRDILYMMLGVLGAGFGSVLNYYFGSSASSRGKDTALIDKITARNT